LFLDDIICGIFVSYDHVEDNVGAMK